MTEPEAEPFASRLSAGGHSFLLRLGLPALLGLGFLGRGLPAQQPAAPSSAVAPITVHESPHFLVRTDLPAAEARAAVARMEASLRFAADYWQRPARGRITCYLIDDQRHWRDAALDHPLSRILVEQIGGASFLPDRPSPGRAAHRAVIYASARPGVVEHEVVHAYCLQNFGRAGPDWYKEGMASVVEFGETGRQGVQCPADRLGELRQRNCRRLRELVTPHPARTRMVESLDRLQTAAQGQPAGQIPLQAWTATDIASVRELREEYLWNWALCHLLMHNPNYAARFRLLGQDCLSRADSGFAEFFGTVEEELMFEYRFFIAHVDTGYRADLCRWDWDKRFREPTADRPVTCRVLAQRGWQASGLEVRQGASYEYTAAGEWQLSREGDRVGPGGCPQGGQLVGVLLHDGRLGESFPLGAEGQFCPPHSGQLYLRCLDAWNRLSDNCGEVTVTFGVR